jgi:HEAT repeat protein
MTLGSIAEPTEGVLHFLENIVTNDPDHRFIALDILYQFGEASLPTVSQLQQSKDPQVRRALIDRLPNVSIEHFHIFHRLPIEALADSDDTVREFALNFMGNKIPYLPSMILDAMENDNEQIRREAITLLTRRKKNMSANDFPRLIALLRDPSAEVRKSAAVALALYGAEAKNALPILVAMKESRTEKEENRQAAAQAIQKIEEECL